MASMMRSSWFAFRRGVATVAAKPTSIAALGFGCGVVASRVDAPVTAPGFVTAICPVVAHCHSKCCHRFPELANEMEKLHDDGLLQNIYDKLHGDPRTHHDCRLLFHLARATHKLAKTTADFDRRKKLDDETLVYIGEALESTTKADDATTKAEILSYYGMVLQDRGDTKTEEAERRHLYSVAKEHMLAAFREDHTNYLANYAIADHHYGLARKRTEAGRKSIMSITAFYDKSTNNALKEDQESLWRTTARHAYKALMAKPDDIKSINMMAQAKFGIGDLEVAKKYAERAMKLVDQDFKHQEDRIAAKESRELMDKINILLEQVEF